MRPRELATKLRPYGIHSRKVRIEDRTRNGYHRERFVDAFSRYLSGSIGGTSGASALESQKQGTADPEHGLDAPDTEEVANPHSSADVPNVPDPASIERP